MDLGATVGRVMAMLGVVCAVVAIFVLEGISIVFPAKSYGHLGNPADALRTPACQAPQDA